MKLKAVSGIMLTLLLIGMLTLAFNIQPAKASGTIYIRADGSVEPEGTPISSIDNITYTFTDNIYDEIVVERDNIVVDGAGYILKGYMPSTLVNGINLTGRSNVTINNVEVKSFYFGILLDHSSNNTISGNDIINNGILGIQLKNSSNHNTIIGNNVTGNGQGIDLDGSNNTVSGNNVTENLYYGIGLIGSNNSISGNTVISHGQEGIWFYGSGNTVSGNDLRNNGKGIWVGFYSTYNSISGNKITNNGIGIMLVGGSSNNTIFGNNLANNGGGIVLQESSNNAIYANNITESELGGISIYWNSAYNRIFENNITNRYTYWAGICLYSIPLNSINIIYHNNFDNLYQVDIEDSYANLWDDGYPSGGNYWSDHVCTGNPSDGSQPYIIDANNIDHYPFQDPNGWLLPPPEHELIVYLEAPDHVQPDETSLLNATVDNRGLSNETSVPLQLLINGTIVDSVVIPELLTGSSYTLSYLWTPTVEGIYNITAYAPPVLGEYFTANNLDTKFIVVGYPLISYWKFDEGSGTIAYDSVGANHGTIHGATWTTGIVGNALSFDGVDDYVEVLNSDDFNFKDQVSVGMWLNLNTELNDWGSFVSKIGYGYPMPGSGWDLRANGSNCLVFTVVTEQNLGNVDYHTAYEIPLNEWVNIIATYDGNFVRVYTNGEKEFESEATGSLINNEENIILGSQSGFRFINGIIDDVRLYNRALTEAEIQALYYEGVPPNIVVLSPGNKTYSVNDVPLTFTVDESTSWIGYSLDGQANVTITGNITLSDLSDRSHYVVVYANDTVGNMGASSTVYFTIDTTSPVITILSPQNKTYSTSSVPLTFTLNELTSWIGYSLDNQANVTITGNTTLTGLSDGVHTITVYANDTVGNMGYSDTVYFTVDTVSPNIEILSPENKTYTTSSVSLSFTVDEATSWMGYSLDGQANITIAENTTLTELSDGMHSLIVYASDITGNVGYSDIVYFTIQTTPPDTTPPTISIVSPENKTYDTTDIPLTFTVDESVSWMAYSLDGQANMTITGNTTLSGLSDGSHSLIVYAKDTAENTGASEIIYFSIETKKAEPLQTWIVAAIVIIAVVGTALLIYFTKIKKTTEKVQ